MRCSDEGRDDTGAATGATADTVLDADAAARAAIATPTTGTTTTRLRQAINHPLPATTRAREVAWNPTGLRTQVRGFKSPRARQFTHRLLLRRM